MSLKQEASLSQQLNLTPSMQQALKVLQMSLLDLEDETKRLLEDNVFIDIDDSNNSNITAESDITDNSASIVEIEKTNEHATPDSTEHIDDNDYFTANQEPYEPRNHNYSVDDDFDIFSTIGAEQNFIDYVLEQIPNSFQGEEPIAIAKAIAYNLDENGYLSCDLQEIHSFINKVQPIDLQEIYDVHLQFLHLSPAGVGALSPKQCLIAQLEEKDVRTRQVQDALVLVRDHLDNLAFDIRNLTKQLKWDDDRFDAARAMIRQCYAHPADKVAPSSTQYIEADVFVKKINDKWEAFLIRGQHHSLKINDLYVEAIKKQKESEQDPELKQQLIDAKNFINSVEQRDQTLLATAREIVKAQQEFFEKGPIALKPLTLAHISQAVGFHESTISRCTNGKYILTPSGTTELKSFFDRGLSTGNVDGVSARELKERIRSLIESEPPTLRLSDQRITRLLENQGYKVARRTVAKYREAMNIPSSSKRSYCS